MIMKSPLFILPILACLAVAPLRGITITLQLSDVGQGGVNGSGFTPSQHALLEDAASQWEQLLPGYQAGISLSGVAINAFAAPFDGVGSTFAEAGPTGLDFQQGLFLATSGDMHFDLADLAALEAAGTLHSVMMHEIAHVLGFGTLWSLNGLYVEGSGQYVGSAGVAAYAAEFSPGASFVPVELGGSPASRDLHWNEVDGGLGLTGITDALGRDFGNEMMTAWTGPDASARYLSDTSLRSFEDLGFTTIPEPSTALLLLAAVGGMARRRRD
jgi:hypothetical protein